MDNAAIFPILLAGTQQTAQSMSARGRISNRLEFRLVEGDRLLFLHLSLVVYYS